MIGDLASKKDLYDDEKKMDIEEEKRQRGRPKTITLTKEEYHRKYYQQRYSQNKEEIKANCAKNSKKYRDSYKLLLQIYERRNLDDEILSNIEKILE